MKFLGTTLCLTAICAFSSPASAVFFNNSTGLASPQQTITFSETGPLTPQAPVTTQFQALGVTFTGAFGNPDSGPYPNISGDRIGNFIANVSAFPFQADFSSVLSQVAFAQVTGPGNSTFTALLNGVVVESATVPTSPASSMNFFGFTNIAFNQLQISVASADRAFLLDNLQTVTVSAVPEPASWALLLAGLSVVGLAGRRGSARNGRSSDQALSC